MYLAQIKAHGPYGEFNQDRPVGSNTEYSNDHNSIKPCVCYVADVGIESVTIASECLVSTCY